MLKKQETHVSAVKIKAKLQDPATSENASAIEWEHPVKKHFGESFFKNVAVASALVLCAVTLRTGAIPQLSDATDAVLTAATDQSLLDDQLGKLSFVSSLFPEAMLVFGESSAEELSMPVSGGVVVHAWSETEPYLSWRTNSKQVYAVAEGEVIGVYHGYGDERLVQVMGNDGRSCLYGNLEEVYVKTGDFIAAGEQVGALMTGSDFVFELRENGRSINPTECFSR